VLAGSQRTLRMQQPAAGRHHGRHLKSMMSYQNLTLLIDEYLLGKNPCQISSLSDLKRRRLRPSWRASLQ